MLKKLKNNMKNTCFYKNLNKNQKKEKVLWKK